jgi:colicin import membrane protein
MPGATGAEAGTDYPSYIRSRLEDAFRLEDTFRPDRGKLVAIRLTLNRSGRIAALKVEQSSPDKLFNEAVMRAIIRAEKDFKPPPSGVQTELKFIFKPQEVSKK